MLSEQFDFKVREDRRSVIFEGIEKGHADPEGALNLFLRVARDHLVLNVWPVRPQVGEISTDLARVLGPPKDTPAFCGFGDCMDDDKDAPMQTTMWEFDPQSRAEVLEKVKSFLGLK